MGKKGFRDLIVWQKAKDLAVTIYRVSEEGALSRDYGLCDQIRRSAVSVASNPFLLHRERSAGRTEDATSDCL